MPLDPLTRRELERRGVANVRLLLIPEISGSHPNALVLLHAPGVPNPLRGDVEDWLRDAELAEKAEQDHRHRQVIGTAYWTLGIAVVAAIAGIIAAWPVVKEWLK